MRRALALILALAGCASSPTLSDEDLSITKVEPGKEDSSAEAVFLLFTFDGELVTGSSWNVERQIENQLLYTDRPPQRGSRRGSTRQGRAQRRHDRSGRWRHARALHRDASGGVGTSRRRSLQLHLPASSRHATQRARLVRRDLRTQLRRLGRARRRLRIDVVLLPPRAQRLLAGRRGRRRARRRHRAEPLADHRVASPSTTWSGKTASSRSPRSSASTRTAPRPRRTPASRRTAASSKSSAESSSRTRS